MAERVGVTGMCDLHEPHPGHTFLYITTLEGARVMQQCPGQYAICRNCDDRKCMDCVFRVMHDRCEDSCPMCDDPETTERQRLAHEAWAAEQED